MKMTLATIAAIAMMAVPAVSQAATIINNDGQAHSLTITEGGQTSDVAISGGQSIQTCAGGCFITFPNGDRETLSGSETVEINGGKASFK